MVAVGVIVVGVLVLVVSVVFVVVGVVVVVVFVLVVGVESMCGCTTALTASDTPGLEVVVIEVD